MGTKISDEEIKNTWYTYLTTGNMPPGVKAAWFEHRFFRPFIKRLPKSPRCSICYFPFHGIGGFLSRNLLGVRESELNPHLCNNCERFATRYRGGAELETAVLFVDIRNSTTIAEKISPEAFSKLVNRFYKAVTKCYYQNYGLVQKFQGDEVGGFFVPGIAGPGYVNRAIKTAKDILKALGYHSSSGAWINAGAGIHTGITYVGSVTANNGITDISILGDTVNTAARLTSQALSGEIIISEATRKQANISTGSLEFRKLALKGKSTETDAWVIKALK